MKDVRAGFAVHFVEWLIRRAGLLSMRPFEWFRTASVVVLFTVFCGLVGLPGVVRAEPEALPLPDSIEVVARANAASWDAIQSVDVMYDVTSRLVKDGKVLMDRKSIQHHYRKRGSEYRLKLSDLDGHGRLDDRFVTSESERRLTYPLSIDLTEAPLRSCDDRDVKCSIKVRKFAPVDELAPPNLEFIPLLNMAPPMRLTELAQAWKCEFKSTPENLANGQIVIHAVYPFEDDTRRYGTYVDLTLNSSKGFLIERVEMELHGFAKSGETGKYVPAEIMFEVLDWHSSGGGQFYPSEVAYRLRTSATAKDSEFYSKFKATNISLNDTFEDSFLGFSFPENAIVPEYTESNQVSKVFIWGKNNAPVQEFSTEDEYEAYRRSTCNADTRLASSRARLPLSSASSWNDVKRGVVAVNFGVIAILLFLWMRRRSKPG